MCSSISYNNCDYELIILYFYKFINRLAKNRLLIEHFSSDFEVCSLSFSYFTVIYFWFLLVGLSGTVIAIRPALIKGSRYFLTVRLSV